MRIGPITPIRLPKPPTTEGNGGVVPPWLTGRPA